MELTLSVPWLLIQLTVKLSERQFMITQDGRKDCFVILQLTSSDNIRLITWKDWSNL